MTSTLAILGYHKIGPPPADGWETWYYISEARFEEQLLSLRDGGFEFINDRQLVEALDDPAKIPAKSALVTFDDGVRSLLDSARRVLTRLKIPAIVFVPTSFIGGTNDFDQGAEPREQIADWNDLAKLDRCGIAVQSHGVSHRGLSDLSPQQIENEFRDSKLALEAHLKKPIDLYAYAFGDEGRDANLTASLLTKFGYRAAMLYGHGATRLPADRFRLPRFAMGAETNVVDELRAKLA